MLVADPIRQGQDWVKILDFGIAKLNEGKLEPDAASSARASDKGSVMGTPLYMAPEQFGKAEQADGKADVFSLGVVLYELLTGTLPFTRISFKLLQHSSDTAAERLRGVNPILGSLILQMISAESTERSAMAEVEQRLSVLLPEASSPPSVVQIPGSALRIQVIIGILALLAVHVVVALFFLSQREPSHHEAKTHALSLIKTSLDGPDASLQQRAVWALGQSGDMTHRRLVESRLQSPHPDVASAAVHALGSIGAVESQPLLLELLSTQKTPTVELALAETLSRLRHPEGMRKLTEILERKSSDPVLRFQAATRMVELGNPAGSALLWDGLSHGRLSEMTRIATLSPLALSGDSKAKEQLQDAYAHAVQPQGKLFAAFTLARLGDEQARKFLTDTQVVAGPLQLLSAQLLSALGDPAGKEVMLRAMRSSREPDSVRELAIAGLSDCGADSAVTPLDQIITSERDSVPLRLSAAGALLRVLIDTHSQLTQQSLTWAYVALGSSQASTRELAVAALGQIDSEESIPHLRQALRDEAKEVRKTAVQALGRKRVRAALLALQDSLDDRDVDVRAVSLRAIARVLDSLHKQGDSAADGLILTRLAQVTQTGTEPDRIAAAAILLQLGDKNQGARLLSALHASDPLVRKLALEFAQVDEAALQNGLQDEDRGVRFTAAKRLLERGSKLGVSVLKEIALVADVMGLSAYNKLRAMGEQVVPPDGLSRILQAADLHGRLDALDVVAEMPVDKAVDLLFLASRDLAGAVRYRVAEIAKEMYLRTGVRALLHLLQGLAQDTDPLVRSAAQLPVAAQTAPVVTQTAPVAAQTIPVALAQQNAMKASEQATQNVTEKTAPSAPSTERLDLGAAAAPSEVGRVAAGTGLLLIEAGELVRVAIEHGAPAVVSKKPLSLSVGTHRLHFVGGERDVTIRAGETTTVTLAVLTADQLLADGKEAFVAGKLERAKELFERLRGLERRGRVRKGSSAEIALHLAKIYESANELGRAVEEYSRLRAMPDIPPSFRAIADKAMSRLAFSVGHIILFRPSNTDTKGCVRDDLYLPPGNHILDVGLGKTKTEMVRVQAGTTVTLSKCR